MQYLPLAAVWMEEQLQKGAIKWLFQGVDEKVA